MKNENLVVQGKEAKYFLNTCEFTKKEEFIIWQMKAFEAYNELYGKDACIKNGIKNLTDLFGENFSKTFYHLKNFIILNNYLKNIENEIKYLEEKRKIMYNLYKKDFIDNEDIKMVYNDENYCFYSLDS